MHEAREDLDSPDQIRRFVEAFYERLLADPELAPIFLEVAGIDIRQHFGHIRAYWEKLLLGVDDYRRHTMNMHRALHARRSLSAADFSRWLAHFEATLDAGFAGPRAERARAIARAIAGNMQIALDVGR